MPINHPAPAGRDVVDEAERTSRPLRNTLSSGTPAHTGIAIENTPEQTDTTDADRIAPDIFHLNTQVGNLALFTTDAAIEKAANEPATAFIFTAVRLGLSIWLLHVMIQKHQLK